VQPYENQLIGAFLICLGFQAARAGHAVPPSANLFQQNPGDSHYGDLLIGCKTIIAMEFKRTADDVRSERNKYGVLPQEWYAPTLLPSDTYHFMVYGDPIQPLHMAYTFYRSVFLIPLSATASHGAEQLIEVLLKGRCGGRATDVDAYLKRLSSRRKKKDGSGSTGGFCVIGKKENGALCIAVESSLEKMLEHDHSVGHDAAEQSHQPAESELDTCDWEIDGP
jgi:hypothetical protein